MMQMPKRRNLILSGILQSGESIFMQYLIVAIATNLPFINIHLYVHDEIQFTVDWEDKMSEIDLSSLLHCEANFVAERLDIDLALGDLKSGDHWAETH